MSVKIPIKYLKKKESGFIPIYVIEAPVNTPELSGYVMKMPQQNVEVCDTYLLLYHGNEWDKKVREHYFMFEKEEKVKGHPAKRYRYSEDEFFKLYERAKSKRFDQRLEERIQRFQKGPGRLLRASYSDYKDRAMIKSTNWLIEANDDKKWVYEFSYDPLRDIGKHNKMSKGFSVLEEYPVMDISLLIKNKDTLPRLLNSLDHIRELKIKIADNSLIYKMGIIIHDKFGSIVTPNTLSEAIAMFAYKMIPDEITEERTISHGLCAKTEADEFRNQLIEMATEMEKKCFDFFESYCSERINTLTEEIKEMTGISISKVIK